MNGRYCERGSLNNKPHFVNADGNRHLYWGSYTGQGDRWVLDSDINPSSLFAYVASSQATPPLGAITWRVGQSACGSSGWADATLFLTEGRVIFHFSCS